MAYSVQNMTSRTLVLNLVGGNTLRLPPRQARKSQMILDDERMSPDILNCERAKPKALIRVSEVKEAKPPSAPKAKKAAKPKPPSSSRAEKPKDEG